MRRRTHAAFLGYGAAVLVACGGRTGSPAAPSALELDSFDATIPDAVPVEASAPTPVASLAGSVVANDAGVSGAFVVAEVGGLGGVAPGFEGGATTASDPFIRYAALTNDAGAFSFSVPAGSVGLHTLAVAFEEGKQSVQAVAPADGGPSDASIPPVVVSLVPSARSDATLPARPTATRLTPSSSFVAPFAPITFAVELAAASHGDPLSSDLFLVQPDTRWAGALTPPVPVVPGGAYPDGDYSLLVTAPSEPGAYLYTVVIASKSGVTSVPASVLVTVTPSGAPPQPDAGPYDAGVGDAGDAG